MSERTIYITQGARNTPLFNVIPSLCPKNDYSSILYICPNQFIIKETQREFLDFLKANKKETTFIPFRTFTLRGLATSLQMASERGRLISEEMRILILSDIVGERSTGYSNQLSDLLRRIRHYLPHKELSQLRDDVKGSIFVEKAFKRFEDAICLLEKYEQVVKRKMLIDVEMPFMNLVNSSSLASCETVAIGGFYEPTPLELAVIKKVIENSRRVYVSAERDTGLFNFLLSQEMGFRVIKPRQESRRDRAVCYKYRTMEDEVEGIARNVKDLILQGIKPWKIIVTFPVLSRYLPVLRRVLKRYEIPLDIPEADFSKTDPLIALEDMLTSIEEDYPRTEFLSFLTSACFPKIHKTLKEMSVLYSYRAKVIKGKRSWLTLKDNLIATSSNGSAYGGEGGLTEDDRRRLERYGKEMNSIIDILERLTTRRDMLSFMDSFESVLERFGFFNFLRELGEDVYSRIVERFSHLRRFALLYDAFKYEPWFYIRQFLRDIRICSDDIRGVRAIPYELAAGLEADALFLGGLIEEDFPSRPSIDPYLPESVKRELGMPDVEYYVDRQRRYFKRLLNISSREPYLSYPSGEEDKPHLPSPLLDWEMITEPEDLDIFSHEDVLVAEGSLKGADMGSKILWDGRVDKEAIHLLRSRTGRLSKGVINVTDIDSFRRCPMRFYIEKVLGIEMLESPRYEVERRLWGSLAHKVMENLYRDRYFDMDELEQRLKDSINNAFKGFPLSGFWAKVAEEIFRRRLPLLKAQEEVLRDDGFIPYKVEERIMTGVDGLRLKGKIDRVDIKTENKEDRIQNKDNEKQKTVMLLDYKTGLIDNESLQLPLYAYMWQKVHGEVVERTGFYSLKDVRVISFPKRITMDEFISDAMERFRELVERLRKGDFAPQPERQNECRYCYHSPLCSKGE